MRFSWIASLLLAAAVPAFAAAPTAAPTQPKEDPAAYQHLVEALDYDPEPELEALIRRALLEIESLQKMRVPRLH